LFSITVLYRAHHYVFCVFIGFVCVVEIEYSEDAPTSTEVQIQDPTERIPVSTGKAKYTNCSLPTNNVYMYLVHVFIA